MSQTDTYLGTNADRLHEALKRFEAHRNGGAGGETRNGVATDVENDAPNLHGHLTVSALDSQDRSENPRSDVN